MKNQNKNNLKIKNIHLLNFKLIQSQQQNKVNYSRVKINKQNFDYLNYIYKVKEE